MLEDIVLEFNLCDNVCNVFVFVLLSNIRGAFGKFSAWYFISVTDLQTLTSFGIILKNYLSLMLWHKFYEDIIMQTRKILV